MLYRGFKKPLIRNGEYLYEVIGEYPIDKIKDVGEVRRLLKCDIALRNNQNNQFLFARRVKEVEIINEEPNNSTT